MAGEFDLHHLLAGPIIAMNDAQADAAASFYELFDQFAFEPHADGSTAGEPRRLRTISFIAERATAEGIERRQISMPLLQMIPIGGVAIDSAKMQFALALNAEPLGPTAPATAPAPGAAAARAVSMKARIAPTATGAAPTGNLQVEIVLKQVDLPAGYLDMIAETQGGMSRLLPQGQAHEAPLFAATLVDVSPPFVVNGARNSVAIEIVPNAALIGEGGLALNFRAEPGDAFTVRAPAALSQLNAERRSGRLDILAREIPAGTELALLIDGTATRADGTQIQHAARLALPRATAEKK